MQLEAGLALYSVLAELKEDYLGTLEKVKEIGYQNIEYVGTPTDENGKPVVSAKEIGEKVRELGLNPVSSHVMMDESSDIDALIEENLQMGAKAIVLPFYAPFTDEETKRRAEFCNQVGQKCKDNGLKFYYHNHFHEFIDINGKYALERLAEYTDPNLVQFELDLYWIMRGGADPIEMLRRFGPRCSLVHQKDLNKDNNGVNVYEKLQGEPTMENITNQRANLTQRTDIVPVGTGVMDIKTICDTVKELGHAPYIFVELDSVSSMTESNYTTPLSPLQSVKLSLENLKKAIG